MSTLPSIGGREQRCSDAVGFGRTASGRDESMSVQCRAGFVLTLR